MKTIGGWIIVALCVFGISLFTKKEEPKENIKVNSEIKLPEPKLVSPTQVIDSVIYVEKKKNDTVLENVEKNVRYLQRKIKEIDTLSENKDTISGFNVWNH